MTKVFLGKDETFNAANDNLTIFGGAGIETVTIMGAGITVDQNVEQVIFCLISSKFLFLQAGNALKVFDVSGATLIATIPVQIDGTVLSFAGETFNATLSNAAVMKVGDVMIGSTNAIAISVTPPLATLTASSTSVNEGSAVTYTATSSVPAPASGLSVPYTLGGTATAADYTTTSTGNIVIAAGATAGTLVLNAVADNLTEGAETVTVALGTIAGFVVSVTPVTTTIYDTSINYMPR